VLTGGGEADDFIFATELRDNSIDTITDFATGEDRIVIKGALVNTGPGVLGSDAFHLGTEATTANHRFVYDGQTLW
jgi:Ca2+-binding RTX toxin-like protein